MKMSKQEVELIEVLIKEIRESARREAEQIIEEARRKAKSIIEEAEIQAKKMREEKLLQARRNIRLKLLREIAPRRERVKQHYLKRKYELIKGLMDKATRIALSHVESQDKYYVRSLEKLLLEAIRQLGSNDLIVYCRSVDSELVRKAILKVCRNTQRKSVNMELAKDGINCLGGIIVRSRDGREYFNNTIESRISRAEKEYLPLILREIF